MGADYRTHSCSRYSGAARSNPSSRFSISGRCGVDGQAGQLSILSVLGVNRQAVSGIGPDITLLPTLARTLGVDLNTLLSFREDYDTSFPMNPQESGATAFQVRN